MVPLALVGVARGRKKGMKALVEYFERNREADSEGGVVLTGNADCPKDVARLEDMLVKADEDLVLVDCNIGPVIGCHVGPDMIAVAFWGKDRRETVSVVDRIANQGQEESLEKFEETTMADKTFVFVGDTEVGSASLSIAQRWWFLHGGIALRCRCGLHLL